MSSRERILAKVKAGVAAGPAEAAGPTDSERRAIVERRLAAPPAHPVPARVVGKSNAELSAAVKHWLELAGGEMVEVATSPDVPEAVAAFLRRHNLPARLRLGADPRLAAMPWQFGTGLTIDHGPAEVGDTASVTHARAAVAETGTLLVRSGPDNPVTLSFLAESNIVVVARGDIVGPLEAALALARATGGMPRTANLISGPSRSADIGGVPVLGAHGPRRLCLIVVG